jgi:hypothetical protein
MNEYSPKNALSLTVAKVAELLLKEDKNLGRLLTNSLSCFILVYLTV